MSITFKQFLTDGTLSSLPYELFFRKEMHLPKDVAPLAVRWAAGLGTKSGITYRDLPGDTWDHMIDWASVEYEKENPGKDFHKAANMIGIEAAVRSMIAIVMRKRYRLKLMLAPVNEEQSPLKDLAIELFFRKEFKADKDQARELRLWYQDEKDWNDLEFWARDLLVARWGPDKFHNYDDADVSYSDLVYDKVSAIMMKHGLQEDTQ